MGLVVPYCHPSPPPPTPTHTPVERAQDRIRKGYGCCAYGELAQPTYSIYSPLPLHQPSLLLGGDHCATL